MQDSHWILSFFPMILEIALKFKYSVDFSKEKNKLVRKMTMGKTTRKKLFVDESRM